MKLIIDISNEDYEFIKNLQSLVISSRGNTKTIQYNVINAIKNGIPCNQIGEWVHYLGCDVGKAVCSKCGQVGETKNYCGNCGARMEGGYS